MTNWITIFLLLTSAFVFSIAISRGAEESMIRYWYELRRGAILARRLQEINNA